MDSAGSSTPKICKSFTYRERLGVTLKTKHHTTSCLPFNRVALLKAHGQKAMPVIAALESALAASNPALLVRKSVSLDGSCLRIRDAVGKTYQYDIHGRVFVIGGGKAAALMASELRRILGGLLEQGTISVPRNTTLRNMRNLSFTDASHPIPDRGSIMAAENMIRVVRSAGPKDLILAVISGGASSLIARTPKGLTLEDKQRLTENLLESGATIKEINIVRKHVSDIKGGRLIRLKNNSTPLVALVLSDVVDNDIGSIASGLTAPDSSTFRDALAVLKKYRIKAHSKVFRWIARGIAGEIPESPKPGDPIFKNVANIIIGDNTVACNAALSKLSSLGFRVHYLGSNWIGDAREFGSVLYSIMSHLSLAKDPAIAVVAGGETTVDIRHGSGMGGRNQEVALSFACAMERGSNMVAGFLGTDGRDGNSCAAGGLVSRRTIRQIRRSSLVRFLNTHDSYKALRLTKSIIITGDTRTNVNDIGVVISNTKEQRTAAVKDKL